MSQAEFRDSQETHSSIDPQAVEFGDALKSVVNSIKQNPHTPNILRLEWLSEPAEMESPQVLRDYMAGIRGVPTAETLESWCSVWRLTQEEADSLRIGAGHKEEPEVILTPMQKVEIANLASEMLDVDQDYLLPESIPPIETWETIDAPLRKSGVSIILERAGTSVRLFTEALRDRFRKSRD